MLLLNLKILSPQDVLRVVRFIIGHQIKSSIAPEMVETVPVCYGQFGDVSKIIFINRSALKRYDVRNAIRYQSEDILACIQDLKCSKLRMGLTKVSLVQNYFQLEEYFKNQELPNNCYTPHRSVTQSLLTPALSCKANKQNMYQEDSDESYSSAILAVDSSEFDLKQQQSLEITASSSHQSSVIKLSSCFYSKSHVPSQQKFPSHDRVMEAINGDKARKGVGSDIGGLDVSQPVTFNQKFMLMK